MTWVYVPSFSGYMQDAGPYLLTALVPRYPPNSTLSDVDTSEIDYVLISAALVPADLSTFNPNYNDYSATYKYKQYGYGFSKGIYGNLAVLPADAHLLVVFYPVSTTPPTAPVLSFVTADMVTGGTAFAPAVPANDNFVNRIVIPATTPTGTFAVSSNESASIEPGEYFVNGNTTWYEWVAPFTGIAKFQSALDSTGLSSVVVEYFKASVNGIGNFPTSSPASTAYASPGLARVSVVLGDIVYLSVDPDLNAIHPSSDSLVSWSQSDAPANDNFASATVLSGDTGTIAVSTVNATSEPGENVFPNQTVWYAWTAAVSARQAFYFDRGSSPSSLLKANVKTSFASAPIATTQYDNLARTSFDAVAGTTYYVQVFGLDFTGTLGWEPAIPPANDNLANAQVVTGASGSVLASLKDATIEPYDKFAVNSTNPGSIWYSWTAPDNTPVWFRLENGDGFVDRGPAVHHSYAGVYTRQQLDSGGAPPAGSGSLFEKLTSVRQDFPIGPPRELGNAGVCWNPEAGKTYIIGFNSNVSLFATMKWSPRVDTNPYPAGDSTPSVDHGGGSLTYPGAIDRGSFSTYYSRFVGMSVYLVGGGAQLGEPLLGCSQTVWYAWKAPATIRQHVQWMVGLTPDRNYPGSVLQVFTGSPTDPVNTLTLVGNATQPAVDSADGYAYPVGYFSPSEVASVDFDAVVDQYYFFQLSTLHPGATAGELGLFSSTPAQPEDHPEYALVLPSTLDGTRVVNLIGSTKDAHEPSVYNNFTRTVWLSWTAPAQPDSQVMPSVRFNIVKDPVKNDYQAYTVVSVYEQDSAPFFYYEADAWIVGPKPLPGTPHFYDSLYLVVTEYGNSSLAYFRPVAGQKYWIQVLSTLETLGVSVTWTHGPDWSVGPWISRTVTSGLSVTNAIYSTTHGAAMRTTIRRSKHVLDQGFGEPQFGYDSDFGRGCAFHNVVAGNRMEGYNPYGWPTICPTAHTRDAQVAYETINQDPPLVAPGTVGLDESWDSGFFEIPAFYQMYLYQTQVDISVAPALRAVIVPPLPFNAGSVIEVEGDPLYHNYVTDRIYPSNQHVRGRNQFVSLNWQLEPGVADVSHANNGTVKVVQLHDDPTQVTVLTEGNPPNLAISGSLPRYQFPWATPAGLAVGTIVASDAVVAGATGVGIVEVPKVLPADLVGFTFDDFVKRLFNYVGQGGRFDNVPTDQKEVLHYVVSSGVAYDDSPPARTTTGAGPVQSQSNVVNFNLEITSLQIVPSRYRILTRGAGPTAAILSFDKNFGAGQAAKPEKAGFGLYPNSPRSRAHSAGFGTLVPPA